MFEKLIHYHTRRVINSTNIRMFNIKIINNCYIKEKKRIIKYQKNKIKLHKVLIKVGYVAFVKCYLYMYVHIFGS